MISYARVSEIVKYISEEKLWADWKNGTRCGNILGYWKMAVLRKG